MRVVDPFAFGKERVHIYIESSFEEGERASGAGCRLAPTSANDASTSLGGRSILTDIVGLRDIWASTERSVCTGAVNVAATLAPARTTGRAT